VVAGPPSTLNYFCSKNRAIPEPASSLVTIGEGGSEERAPVYRYGVEGARLGAWRSDIALLAVTVDGVLGPGGGGCREAPVGLVAREGLGGRVRVDGGQDGAGVLQAHGGQRLGDQRRRVVVGNLAD